MFFQISTTLSDYNKKCPYFKNGYHVKKLNFKFENSIVFFTKCTYKYFSVIKRYRYLIFILSIIFVLILLFYQKNISHRYESFQEPTIIRNGKYKGYFLINFENNSLLALHKKKSKEIQVTITKIKSAINEREQEKLSQIPEAECKPKQIFLIDEFCYEPSKKFIVTDRATNESFNEFSKYEDELNVLLKKYNSLYA